MTAAAGIALLLLAPVSGRPRSAPVSLPVFTTAEQIRELSPDQARRRYPVRIRAVVTYCDPSNLDYYVRDSTAGIYINELHGQFKFKPGQLLEIEGVTEEPDFAPQIGEPRYRVLGEAPLPQAKRVSLDALASTREDSQWVEFDGIVDEADPDHGRLTLDVAGGGGHLRVIVLEAGNLTSAALVDARIRVRGVAATIFNQKNQLIGAQINVPSSTDVIVEHAAPSDPFAIPLRSLSSLMVFAAHDTSEHRIRVQGTVTLPRPTGVFIQDGAQGLYLPGAARGTVTPGDRVDVVGFSDIGDYTPGLRHAIFRKIGLGAPPAPVSVTAHQALGGAYDTLLVRIDGTLRETTRSEADHTLVLQDGNTLFEARIADDMAGRSLRAPPLGSRLRLTGICSVSVDRNRSRTVSAFYCARRPMWWCLLVPPGGACAMCW